MQTLSAEGGAVYHVAHPRPPYLMNKQAKLLAIDGLNIVRRVYEASPEPGT
jgi:hypothetical protein